MSGNQVPFINISPNLYIGVGWHWHSDNNPQYSAAGSCKNQGSILECISSEMKKVSGVMSASPEDLTLLLASKIKLK
ncbi:hypothetical protein FCM35_KLT12051 [Carex littledalei]|uniref:Uncharacterized protein n=1 Tax=Carex littledalei TaxID=544730 RepID=A0A833QB41_9POAL|nr:hypothetical protein FCM35_KLT12051 [Carex littledalei]